MTLSLLYLAAFAAAFLTALAALPVWLAWCRRTGLVDDPGHRKIHRDPIPLAGGLAVMTGLLVPIALGVVLLLVHPTGESSSSPYFLNSELANLLLHGLKVRSQELAAILIGATGMLLVGIWDDKHELRPSIKFAAQFLVALLVAASGIRITLFVPSLLFSYAITILWILTVINAFNFMDNMNGLCGGLGAIGAFYFGWIAAGSGHYLVALLAWLACGALLGFLPYNFPRARAFLGDAGSHLVGFLLSVLAILPHFHTAETPRAWAVLSPLWILAVPLADLAWVVVLRWRLGKPFYIGDNNHLSHRLVRRGLSTTHAVLVIWVLALIVGAVALL